jgi:hypothetical protein
VANSNSGVGSVAIVLISTLSGIAGGVVSFMDQHSWVAVLVTGLGAAVITTAGNFVYRRSTNAWRMRARAAEAELVSMRKRYVSDGAGE